MVTSFLYLLFQLRRRARQGSYPALHSALTTLACMHLVLTLNQVNQQFWNVFVFKLKFFAIFQISPGSWKVCKTWSHFTHFSRIWKVYYLWYFCYIVGVYSDTDGGQLVFLLQGQQGGVTHVLFSPDGTKLYSGGRKVKWHQFGSTPFPFLRFLLMLLGILCILYGSFNCLVSCDLRIICVWFQFVLVLESDIFLP